MIKKQNLFKLAAIITAIVLIAIISVGVTSCTGPEGPMGPEGPQGPSGSGGKDGVGGSDGQDGQDGQNGESGSNMIWYTVTYISGEHATYVNPNKFAEGTVAYRPESPTRPFDVTVLIPGLYRAEAGGWIFNGWFLGDERYDFNTPITSNITLTADWATPGLVTDEEMDGKDITASDYIEAACAYINKEPRGYLLLLDRDYTVNGTTGIKLEGRDVSLTVRGNGVKRTITSNTTDGMLFDVNNGAGLTLEDDIILQGKQTATRPLISIINQSKLIMMNGSKITGHKTTSANGTVYVLNQGSSFTMNGGEISDNETTFADQTAAGAVFMGLNSEFIMNGGKISGNKASNATTSGARKAGGVYCDTGSRITLNGGEISGNTGGAAGGIYLLSGTFLMNDGKISGNTGTDAGAIRTYGISNSYFTMNGGEISGNNGGGTGGIYSQSPITMNGGTITGNTGASYGGINMTTDSSITFSGGSITGNIGPRGDVCMGIGVTTKPVILAGNGLISTLTVANINSSTFIQIASGWTGEVETLNLHYADVSFPTVATQWAGKKVIQAASGHTLTTADIDKFKQVNFMNSNNLTRAISEEGRVIVRTGANIGNLQ